MDKRNSDHKHLPGFRNHNILWRHDIVQWFITSRPLPPSIATTYTRFKFSSKYWKAGFHSPPENRLFSKQNRTWERSMSKGIVFRLVMLKAMYRKSIHCKFITVPWYNAYFRPLGISLDHLESDSATIQKEKQNMFLFLICNTKSTTRREYLTR